VTPRFQGHGVTTDALDVLYAQLTRDLFVIAKFLVVIRLKADLFDQWQHGSDDLDLNANKVTVSCSHSLHHIMNLYHVHILFCTWQLHQNKHVKRKVENNKLNSTNFTEHKEINFSPHMKY